MTQVVLDVAGAVEHENPLAHNFGKDETLRWPAGQAEAQGIGRHIPTNHGAVANVVHSQIVRPSVGLFLVVFMPKPRIQLDAPPRYVTSLISNCRLQSTI